jgi:hypothetical protein
MLLLASCAADGEFGALPADYVRQSEDAVRREADIGPVAEVDVLPAFRSWCSAEDGEPRGWAVPVWARRQDGSVTVRYAWFFDGQSSRLGGPVTCMADEDDEPENLSGPRATSSGLPLVGAPYLRRRLPVPLAPTLALSARLTLARSA